MNKPYIVGIGGTTRPGSSSEQMVRAVTGTCDAQGASVRMFGGTDLAALPHFQPENSERTGAQRELVEAVRACDGIVIGSPGYHGGVSGLVKNAIDLLEDLSTDARVYFDRRAVGLVVTAAGWQACGATLQAMRGIVHAMRGWPTPIGIAMNSVEQRPFDAHGQLVDQTLKRNVEMMVADHDDRTRSSHHRRLRRQIAFDSDRKMVDVDATGPPNHRNWMYR